VLRGVSKSEPEDQRIEKERCLSGNRERKGRKKGRGVKFL